MSLGLGLGAADRADSGGGGGGGGGCASKDDGNGGGGESSDQERRVKDGLRNAMEAEVSVGLPST